MMRGPRRWAVAVRTAAGDIAVEEHPWRSALARRRWLRLPVVRGVVALGESLAIGVRALGRSAEVQSAARGERPPTAREWAFAVVMGLALAVVLFFVVPVVLTSLVKERLGSAALFWLVEGLVRTAIFVGYLVLVARQRDLARVFAYHGAEHKAIHCHEAGLPLTPEHAARMSRLHPRCGTSFLLLVMVVAIFVFAPIGLPAWGWLVASRVLGIPLVAGIAFELIKLAGRHRHRRPVRVLMAPGMALQRLTTREPDAAQLAVAIAALQAVLADDEVAEHDLVGIEVAA
jgi:uncharacterized protein YqhQ